ncbi:hypothetical protein AALO_G00027230 [Alosa alosa]|uniref:Uncharacterized protein n=1 Tax=Alosa alosa TaxID=278164 RepID=A0AAV6HBG4_9TELE|nr:hypothetical protein AALO_G00027230 [Alosa alosa]
MMKYWFSVTGLLSTNKTVVRRDPRKQKGTELRLIPRVSLGLRVDSDDGSTPAWQKGGVVDKKRCAESDAIAQAKSQAELKILACSQCLFEALEELTIEELEQFRLCVTEGILEVFVPIPEELLPNLFDLLPSGKRYRSLRSRTTRLTNSFIHQAVRMLNSLPPLPPPPSAT